MPIYDLECEPCQRFLIDVFFTLTETPTCSYCNAPARVVISPVRTVGPMPSKPLEMEAIGREFTSAKDYHNYQRANPDLEFLDKNDSKWRKHVDLARDKAEKKASRQGFRDLTAKRTWLKKEKAKKMGA